MKLLVLFFYIFFFSSNLFANDKVVILDLDKVFTETSCIEISSSQLKDLEHGRRPPLTNSNKGLVILKHANKIAGLARIDNGELIKEFLV